MNASEEIRRLPRDERGFTLLEAVVAMAILAFGIVTVCLMQGAALRDSTMAYNRTEANNVALALVEALQQLPPDDAMLKPTGNGKEQFGDEDGDGGLRRAWLVGDLGKDGAHKCVPAGDGECGSDVGGSTRLGNLLKPVFTVHPNGMVTDRSGIPFELRWAVQQVLLDDNAEPTDWIIRVHMEWDTPAGKNHLEYTANKYVGEG